ncbi:glycoside hydrolase domain-containing protein [Nocardioides sp. MAHUQ-72]|uniref:glycoside hydrolase domain-containing protein n=1 Tax=unclassified Nocardioides TaxID=2615069 RepID=UPI003618B953
MSRWAASTARAAVLSLVAGVFATLTVSAPARAVDTPVTPGDFTGYGFDQCLAPDQQAMNAWLNHSPFLAAGIYIAGDSRACRSQPNLTPKWIRTQLTKGWRLLPITLGPQASCQPRFPRYGDDETIIPDPGSRGKYVKARKQGRAEAVKTVGVATSLGIVKGSTLWYDLEGYDNSNTNCRESALAFLSGWTWALHDLGYVSGVYSSAGSGMVALDNARVSRPDAFHLPDQIWIARWDGKADTSTSYIREDGWQPHARIKQYQGGHDETWGRTRINIDRNYLDLGRGSVAARETHCDGVRVNWRDYVRIRPATEQRTPDAGQVSALQCLLKEHEVYGGKVNGVYNAKTVAAANAWQQQHGLEVSSTWSRTSWMTLLADGDRPVLKIGSAGPAVRRVQRALNAASRSSQVVVTGVFSPATQSALRAWQDRAGLTVEGIANPKTWQALAAGRR